MCALPGTRYGRGRVQKLGEAQHDRDLRSGERDQDSEAVEAGQEPNRLTGGSRDEEAHRRRSPPSRRSTPAR